MRYLLILFALLSGANLAAQLDTTFQLEIDKGCLFYEGYRSAKLKVEQPAEVIHSSFSAYFKGEQDRPALQFRFRGKGGWSEWRAMKDFHEGDTPGRITYGLEIVEQPFDSVQLRSPVKMEQTIFLRIYYAMPALEKKSPALKADTCGCTAPVICDRDCWCPGGNCPEDATPVHHIPTHFIVHHTAGSNSAGNYRAVMRSIWDFHVNTNGWDDIGYNYLISPGGEIYRGRGDSLRGAHFSCMNSETMGTALIGNFQQVAPSDTALRSLEQLLARSACRFNVDANDTLYHSSSQLQLPTIAGHKDGNSATVGCPKGTVCPGDSLYPLLPQLRRNIKSKSCLQGIGLDDYLVEKIQVYPQPASVRLTVVGLPAGPHQYRILNLQGKILRSGYVGANSHSPVSQGANSHSPVSGNEIDIRGIKDGIYLLEIIGTKGRIAIRPHPRQRIAIRGE